MLAAVYVCLFVWKDPFGNGHFLFSLDVLLLQYVLWFLACCSDGVTSVNDGAAGSQKWKLKGGLGSLATLMAKQLVSQALLPWLRSWPVLAQCMSVAPASHLRFLQTPGSLHLDSPVVAVRGWDGRSKDGTVIVQTARGLVFQAQAVVCALPPVRVLHGRLLGMRDVSPPPSPSSPLHHDPADVCC